MEHSIEVTVVDKLTIWINDFMLVQPVIAPLNISSNVVTSEYCGSAGRARLLNGEVGRSR